jgi:DHA2 family multidrug resistance protein-like MFS transporter
MTAHPAAAAFHGADDPAPAKVTPPDQPPTGLDNPRRFWAMATVVTAVGMATLDSAIANTALPTIAGDLQASAAASVWVINAYQLAMVATLLPCAALGEILGHRRIYIAGLILFTLASLGCGLASSLPTLSAARVVQGLGASGIMSVNAALIRFIYPPKLLGRGMGANALAVALAFVAGPSIASVILALAPWPWLFIVNVPLGLAAILLARTALPDTGRATHGFDALAALLASGTLGLLIFGIGDAAHAAPLRRVALELLGALLCGIVLLRRQGRHPAPILPFDLFRRPLFALSAATSVGSFAAQGLAFVALPFLFEVTLHRSQVATGFLMTPWPLLVAVMAPIAGRLSDRFSAGALCGLGLAMLAAGLAALALMPAKPSLFDIIWRLALCGAGFGFFQSPNLRALMTSAPAHRSGSASGIVATGRLFGQTIGAALVAACFSLSGAHGAVLALGLGGLFAGAASVASFSRLLLPTGRG